MNGRYWLGWAASQLTVLTLSGLPAAAEEILVMRRDFIEQIKNRLTISVEFIIDAAHRRPNPATKDGDMHIAGRSPQIGLATVAEIQNAKDSPPALRIVRDHEGTDTPVQMTGVWRIWSEHGGDKEHSQVIGAGPQLTGPGPTNPPHVFEIHPVLQIGSVNLRFTLKPIPGFRPKDARDAFHRYESARFEIESRPNDPMIKMNMRMVGFNYVKFLMKLTRRFNRVVDGEFLAASIHEENGELLVHDRRVGFVVDTPPDRKQQTLQPGQCMLVLGIPRLDLALVSWRVANSVNRPEALRWSLPYEIIAVGVYNDQPRPCGDE